MLRIIRTMAVVATFAIAVPATSQTLLDQLVAKVAKRGTTGNPTSAGLSQDRFTAALSPAQSATLEGILMQPQADRRIAADRDGAAALIREVVATGACAKASPAWNSVNRFSLTPQTFRPEFSNELVPMYNLKYHDKTRCLDVLRIADWTKPADNALKFRVYYIAADSGEAKHQTFELQKGSDGQWLIREIGVGLN